MADDLDNFLKQAAARRQQRQQKKESRPSLPPAPVDRSKAAIPARSLEPEQARFPTSFPQIEKQVTRLEPHLGNLTPTAAATSRTSNPAGSRSENLPNRNTAATPIGEGYQKELSKIRAAEQNNQKERKRAQPLSQSQLAETVSTDPSKRAFVPSNQSLVQQLRDPKSLRMAILAQEVLKRPWQ